MGCVYKAENKVNGKCYIGKTVETIESRIVKHEWNANNSSEYAFHRALRKYGFDNFEWEILYESNDEEELEGAEIFYIEDYESFGSNGYNMTDGGEGTSGFIFSEESKIRMSKSQKKRFEDPKEREKASIAHSRKFEKYPALRENISECQKKRYEDSKEREKASRAAKEAYDRDPTLGGRISKSQKERYKKDPTLGEKISRATKKRCENPAYIEKMSRVVKKALKNPVVRKKMSEAAKKRMEDPATREKISKAMKGKPWSKARREVQDKKKELVK